MMTDTTETFFLNVDKPKGLSSRKIVDLVGRAAQTRKCGHAGTLDPMATGVLVVGVGKATRLVEYVQGMPKTYIAQFTLGKTSETDDAEGEITINPEVDFPDRSKVLKELANFQGTIQQTPPAHSAVKVKGKRAYSLARQGKEVNLTPRPVTVHEIELLDYEAPELRLKIVCGSGTYIRSIARELGKAVGTGALMSSLTRTAIGGFLLEDAVTVDQLEDGTWKAGIQRPQQVTELLPTHRLTHTQAADFRNGKRFRDDSAPADADFFALTPEGDLLGVAHKKDGQVKVLKGGFS